MLQCRSLVYWFRAARPKTLVAGMIPVFFASAFAFRLDTFKLLPAFLCLMFALWAQIAANLFNDYYDFCKGADSSDRIGPERALASGWLSPRTLLLGAFIALGVGCAFGLGLLFFGGWELLIVGAVSALFCILYSAGPLPLSYIGLGDILVVIFFGFIPVLFTYYVQAGSIPMDLYSLALAVGLVVDNILISNNYRDRVEDRLHHKYTSIVLLGARFGCLLYLCTGLTAALLSFAYFYDQEERSFIAFFLLGIYLILHIRAWRMMFFLEGRELNTLLEVSAKNLVFYGLAMSLGFLV